MSLKDIWTDKIDGFDVVEARHINEIAHSVMKNEEDIVELKKSKIKFAPTLEGNEEDKAPSVKAVNEELDKLGGRIARNDKRITNIEQGIPPELFETDSSVAYKKDVPQNALPYAEISKIGGMTYKDSQTLKSAKVSSVESVGVNLLPESRVPSVFTEFATVEVNDILANHIGERITLSFDVKLDELVAEEWILAIYTYQSNGVGIADSFTIKPSTQWQRVSFETSVKDYGIANPDYNVGRIALYDSYYNTYSIKNMQIVLGDNDLPYRPYCRNTLHIPEAVRPAHGINNEVYDYLDFGEQESVKRVQKIVFDGSADESITRGMLGTEFTLFKFGISGGYNYSPAIINRDIPYKVSFDANDAHFYVNASEVFLALSNSIATDVATLKTYLASNPIEVIYELAELIVTDISDILPADNFIEVEGGGTITAVNENGFDVPSEITYMLEEETV